MVSVVASAGFAIAFGMWSGTLYTLQKRETGFDLVDVQRWYTAGVTDSNRQIGLAAAGVFAATLSIHASRDMRRRAGKYDYCSTDPIHHSPVSLGNTPRKCDASAPMTSAQCEPDFESFPPSSSPVPTSTGRFPTSLPSTTRVVFGSGATYTGTLPTEIGLLTKVTSLKLQRSGFTGAIPSEMGCMTKIELSFDLFGNAFSSTIPTELGFMTKATYGMRLEESELEGPLPTQFGQLVHYESQPSWYSNKLTSTMPTELGNYLILTNSIYLDHNGFTGTIPTQFGRMTKLLSDLWIDDNSLTSSIPTELGSMTRLDSNFELAENKLTGSIPTQLGRLVFLYSGFLLQTNQLESTIPTELGKLTDLSDSTSLEHNKLCGDVPTELNSIPAFTDGWNVSHSSIGTPCAQVGDDDGDGGGSRRALGDTSSTPLRPVDDTGIGSSGDGRGEQTRTEVDEKAQGQRQSYVQAQVPVQTRAETGGTGVLSRRAQSRWSTPPAKQGRQKGVAQRGGGADNRAARASPEGVQRRRRTEGERDPGKQDCPSTCFGWTCDEWLPDYGNFDDDYGFTCMESESDGCDCSGCSCGDGDDYNYAYYYDDTLRTSSNPSVSTPSAVVMPKSVPIPSPTQLGSSTVGDTDNVTVESDISVEDIACVDLAGFGDHGLCVVVCAGQCNCASEAGRDETYPSLFDQCEAYASWTDSVNGECSVSGVRGILTMATAQLALCTLTSVASFVLLCLAFRFKQLRSEHAANRHSNSSDYLPASSTTNDDDSGDEAGALSRPGIEMTGF
mmetsp:Transcript_43133/g.116481  ORF Transcript_43133/g.116481 Transcript_43133/m.116481 type:complete len:785 (-) Transcript_43133:452-2806(-)